MAVQPTVAGGAPSRDIWSDIGGAVGGLFGIPQQQAAHNAQQQSAQQQALATGYGQQAAGIYGGLASQGAQQAGVYNSQYLNLLNRFGGLAGLGGNTVGNNPRQPNTAAGQQGNLAQTLNGQPGQGQPGGGPGENPYQLDQNQQALFNQSNAQLAQTFHQAQSQLAQHLSASGIDDPRYQQVAQEQLQEHFSALQQETQAKFYDQVKQEKLSALQQIISGVGQYGQQGVGQEEAAGSGFLGLAQGAQSFAQQQQNVALQQQSNSQSQINGLLNLGGFAAGGGFGGAGAAAGGAAGVGSAAAGGAAAGAGAGWTELGAAAVTSA